MRAMTGYMVGLIAERRANPTDADLLGKMVAARDNDDQLSDAELLSLAMAILVAGHETTASQIPNFVYTLLTHPDQLAMVRRDLSLIPRAVEEMLRFVPLGFGPTIARYAVEDVELGGVVVKAGEPVLPVLTSANRDQTVYDDANVMDLTRNAQHAHVGFGHGAHHCIGAPLARMELQVAMETLLTRLPKLRFATEESEIPWRVGTLTRSPERLLMTWG
jgi:cytochrome P450